METLAKTIKGFKGLTLQSTINDSTYYNSEEDDAEFDPKIDQLVYTPTSDRKKIKVAYTDTTNVNSPQKLLINQLIPEITPVTIPPIDPCIVDGVVASSGNFHKRQTISSKDIVTDMARVFSDILRW